MDNITQYGSPAHSRTSASKLIQNLLQRPDKWAHCSDRLLVLGAWLDGVYTQYLWGVMFLQQYSSN